MQIKNILSKNNLFGKSMQMNHLFFSKNNVSGIDRDKSFKGLLPACIKGFREIAKSEFLVLPNWSKKMLEIITGDLRNQRIGSVAFVCGAGHPKRIVIYKVMMTNRYCRIRKKSVFFRIFDTSRQQTFKGVVPIHSLSGFYLYK